ncbi:MAG: hypothetical protein OEW58_12275 [Gammaproteobacteria bacterium]|nr:hypothetical protein [Gammaproteobacteria bacterium]
MKLLPIALVVASVAGWPLQASAEDALKSAMQSYEKKLYSDASVTLLPLINKETADRQSTAALTLGMSLKKLYLLYSDFYTEALATDREYLTEMNKKTNGKKASSMAELYLAELDLLEGKFDKAKSSLESFNKQKKIPTIDQEMSAVFLGYALHKSKNADGGNKVWKNAKITSVEAESTLAVFKHRLGLLKTVDTTKFAAALQKNSSDAKHQGRLVSNLIYLYLVQGKTNEAIQLALSEKVTSPAGTDSSNPERTITFYSPDLIGNIAEVFKVASIHYLGMAANNGKYATIAAFHLTDIGIMSRDQKLAKTWSAKVNSANLPPALKGVWAVKIAALKVSEGKQKEVLASWKESMNSISDPLLGAEIVSTCMAVSDNCKSIIDDMDVTKLALTRAYSPLYAAIGRLHLSNNDLGVAVALLELARDKSNKNKIGQNDPILLADLAEVNRKSKAYWEHLEIYFEMSQQFPAVRQIQEAVQSIYSIQQKSAGDVKIF